MSKTFAPILCPVKGTPDISVSFSDASCSEFLVFFGLALLEEIFKASRSSIRRNESTPENEDLPLEAST